MKRVTILLTAFFFASLITLPARAAAIESPLEQVQATINAVLAILHSDAADKPARISEIIRPRFDFEKMARLTLHKYWKNQPEENRKAFLRLFAKMLEKTYITRMCLYSTPEVYYIRERQHRNRAEVDTRIVVNGNTTVQVRYRLHLSGADWKIYDVNIEGISLVRNYRTQLASILRTNDFSTLLHMIEKKVSRNS